MTLIVIHREGRLRSIYFCATNQRTFFFLVRCKQPQGRMWEKPEHADSALIAQLAEHALSKRKVTSSNLVGGFPVRVGVVGNISACHADAPGSIPGRGAVFAVFDTRCAVRRPCPARWNFLIRGTRPPSRFLFLTVAGKIKKSRSPTPLVAPISAPVAQLAARGSHNPKVASSILAGSRLFFSFLRATTIFLFPRSNTVPVSAVALGPSARF